jgi:hypothetical protein
VNDQHRQELLRSSAAYASARLAFANAIVIAQRAGETDEEIAHATWPEAGSILPPFKPRKRQGIRYWLREQPPKPPTTT